jgi:hypothetical protein
VLFVFECTEVESIKLFVSIPSPNVLDQLTSQHVVDVARAVTLVVQHCFDEPQLVGFDGQLRLTVSSTFLLEHIGLGPWLKNAYR